MPYLRDLGERWARAEVTHVMLACPPGEQHTLPLISKMVADTVEANAIVLSAVAAKRFVPIAELVGTLAGTRRVLLGGAGARRSSRPASASRTSTTIR